MDIETENQLRAALAAPDPLAALLEVARSMKSRAISKESATTVFEAFLFITPPLSEFEDDHVRDALDFITGWCPPHMRIFA